MSNTNKRRKLTNKKLNIKDVITFAALDKATPNLAKQLNITNKQHERWLNKRAIWIDNAIFLPKNCFVPDEQAIQTKAHAVTLQSFINHFYNGVCIDFSKACGLKQQQGARWLKQSYCVIYRGRLYRRQTMFKKLVLKTDL